MGELAEGGFGMADGTGFLPAYLATGDDALKRERVAERLEQRIGKLVAAQISCTRWM